MFTPADIQARLRQRPFAPLRIATSGGDNFDVYHPDLVLVGRRDLIIGTASAEDPTTYEQVARVAILYITALEDLPIRRRKNA